MKKIIDKTGVFIEKHVVPYYRDKWGGLRWDIALEERLKDPITLEQYGYKVYSQNDEDGIIQEIFDRIGLGNKTFVEFGVQDGLECNSHLLLLQGWNGLFLEGSPRYYQMILKNFDEAIKNNQLKVINGFITKDNINELISNGGISGEIDLLSIDIDGNDYHIWETINCINPRVVVIEYNAKIPPNTKWVLPYKEDFVWDGDDFFGASLKSLELLGTERGYQLVGTNYAGCNAFFVRSDLASDLFYLPATAEALYNPARYRTRFIAGHPSKRFLGRGELL